MKNLKTVYAYRYNEKEGSYTKTKIENVFVSGTNDAFSLSDTQDKNARLILRVMTEGDIDVSPEDVISFKDGEKPEKPYSVVVSVTKNENGSKAVRHTKILCS